MSGDTRFELWKKANAKPCPGNNGTCGVLIEKDKEKKGCMKITCKICHHAWCWICLGDWFGHDLGKTGGFFACNRF